MDRLFIADDEAAIREGIKCIIDWQALGYEICGEAATGDEALAGILDSLPGLVLMDIRMPGLTGLEVIERSRAAGFNGQFIILSGYSDFKYAQSALRLGVSRYLTKPIDEDELTEAVSEATKVLHETRSAKQREDYLRSKSKREILQDIISGKMDFSILDRTGLGLAAECYQIVIYESFDIESDSLPYQFSELFRLAGPSGRRPSSAPLFEHFEYKHKNLLLLMGSQATDRFRRFLDHYETAPQKGSPLDTLFIAYGCTVDSLEQLKTSYDQALILLARRFFCIEGQHVLGFDELPSLAGERLEPLDNSRIEPYCSEISDYLQTFNRRKVAETLYSLEEYLYHVDSDISGVKLFLIDLYLRIKDTMVHRYNAVEIPFDSNSDIIAFVNSCNYLYEILTHFSKQFEEVMNSIGNSSRDSVMDDILYYINHNYQTNLKLEMIASLFGYNSSYLGKVFNRTVGESFNTYVDRIRIEHALELLREGDLKVYEVADRVGYSNVDYFHKKFKKYVGISPAECRRK